MLRRHQVLLPQEAQAVPQAPGGARGERLRGGDLVLVELVEGHGERAAAQGRQEVPRDLQLPRARPALLPQARLRGPAERRRDGRGEHADAGVGGAVAQAEPLEADAHGPHGAQGHPLRSRGGPVVRELRVARRRPVGQERLHHGAGRHGRSRAAQHTVGDVVAGPQQCELDSGRHHRREHARPAGGEAALEDPAVELREAGARVLRRQG
mmetsp:Transcript_3788/g.12056  ORF Transcript_3788/g.12056 Transcript_3788/m.12056 type:complete len:210 (+) Transcript_3788:272-901(+)